MRKREIEIANMVGQAAGEKMDKLADAVRKDGELTRAEYTRQIGEVKEVVDAVINELSAQEKKNLYDLNTMVDIADLEDTEKEFLMAILYTLANMSTEISIHQQGYIRSVKNYLQLGAVQTSVDLSKIENIDSKKAEKAILQCVMEFLFLAQCNHDYWDEYDDVLDYFSVKASEIRRFQNAIDAIYKATGAEGLAEKYGYVVYEDGFDTPFLGTDDYSEAGVSPEYKSVHLKDAEEHCKPEVKIHAFFGMEYATFKAYIETEAYLIAFNPNGHVWVRIEKETRKHVELLNLTQFSDDHDYVMINHMSNVSNKMFSEQHCVDYYANAVFIFDDGFIYSYSVTDDRIDTLDWVDLPSTSYSAMCAEGKYLALCDRQNGLLCIDLESKQFFYLTDDSGTKVTPDHYNIGSPSFGLLNGKIYIAWHTEGCFSSDGHKFDYESITEFNISTRKSKRLVVSKDLGLASYEMIHQVFSFRNKLFVSSSTSLYQVSFSEEAVVIDALLKNDYTSTLYASANYFVVYDRSSFTMQGVNIDTHEQYELGECYTMNESDGFFSKKRVKASSEMCIVGNWVYYTQSYTDVLSGNISLDIGRKELTA